MANTAPACGQCRHCRERGEAGLDRRGFGKFVGGLHTTAGCAPLVSWLERCPVVG